jgi:hypothetical protein
MRRLIINHAREAAAYAANPYDDDERALVTDPLNDEWFELAEALEELESPRTLEGARAVALAALAEAPRAPNGNIQCGDLYCWLARGCAEYLAGEGRV